MHEILNLNFRGGRSPNSLRERLPSGSAETAEIIILFTLPNEQLLDLRLISENKPRNLRDRVSSHLNVQRYTNENQSQTAPNR